MVFEMVLCNCALKDHINSELKNLKPKSTSQLTRRPNANQRISPKPDHATRYNIQQPLKAVKAVQSRSKGHSLTMPLNTTAKEFQQQL